MAFKVLLPVAPATQREKVRVRIDVTTAAAIQDLQLRIGLQDFTSNHVAKCVIDGNAFNVVGG